MPRYTIYGWTDDQELAERAVETLQEMGVEETRLFEETATDEVMALQIATQDLILDVERRRRNYTIYAIARKGEVGYIGLTYKEIPEERVQSHLTSARNAADKMAFWNWLNEGAKEDDLQVSYHRLGEVNHKVAQNRERLAIRKLKPLFNFTHNVQPRLGPGFDLGGLLEEG